MENQKDYLLSKFFSDEPMTQKEIEVLEWFLLKDRELILVILESIETIKTEIQGKAGEVEKKTNVH